MASPVKIVKAAKAEPTAEAETATEATVETKPEAIPAAPRKLQLVPNGELFRRVRKPFVTEAELRAIGRSPEGCVKAGFAKWV